jgi:hypothetical protein
MRDIAEKIIGILNEFGKRLLERSSKAQHNTGIFSLSYGYQPYISFCPSPQAECIDLCIVLTQKEHILTITADIVCSDGTVLSEMASIQAVLTDPASLDLALKKTTAYIDSQANTILKRLRTGICGSTG